MIRLHLLLIGLILHAAIAHAEEAKAEEVRELAQRLVDRYIPLLDAGDDAALVEAYTEDATVTLVCKDPITGNYMIEVRDTGVNRWNIRQLYRDMHQGLLPEKGPKKIAAKNTVEYASMIAPDLLLIHGYFQPFKDEELRWPFIQVRRKAGDEWLIMSQRVFLSGERAVLWARIQEQNKSRR